MLIDLVQNKAWALHPSKFEEINAFLVNRLQDPKYSAAEEIKIIAAAQSNTSGEQPYEIINGIAVIPVIGTVSKRFNMFMKISGGVSTEMLKRDISTALGDRKVRGIVLDIESPGGAVDGTKELADFIYESRNIKPIISYANGMMASAAYWFGSAAHAIVTNETAIVGSIGVALTHYDLSNQDKANGIVRTEIYAGKYKRLASSEKPLSEEGQLYLQSMVDQICSIFVDSVAKNRGISHEAALVIANGKEFFGKEALESGLVDHIGTLQTAIELASERSKSRMNITTLKKDHPDLHAQIIEMGKAEASAGITEKVSAAVTEERTRAVEILKAQGDSEATLKAIEAGTSVGEAYKGFFLAEKNRKAEALQLMASQSTAAVPHKEPKVGSDSKGYLAEIEKHVAAGMKRSEAVVKVNKEQPALYQEYTNSLG